MTPEIKKDLRVALGLNGFNPDLADSNFIDSKNVCYKFYKKNGVKTEYLRATLPIMLGVELTVKMRIGSDSSGTVSYSIDNYSQATGKKSSIKLLKANVQSYILKALASVLKD